jgi:hemin uptake protein HemP
MTYRFCRVCPGQLAASPPAPASQHEPRASQEVTVATPCPEPARPSAAIAPVAAPVRPDRPDMPDHDARDLTGPEGLARLRLDGRCYTLRITRAGKLILTR